jgi:hypothetical protein
MWYNNSVKRRVSQKLSQCTGHRSTEVNEKNKKSFRKPLDKTTKVWYNKYVIKGDTLPTKERN